MIDDNEIANNIREIRDKFNDNEFLDLVLKKLVTFPNLIDSLPCNGWSISNVSDYSYLLEMENDDKYCGIIYIEPNLGIILQISRKKKNELIKELSFLIDERDLINKSRNCVKKFFFDNLNMLLNNGKVEYNSDNSSLTTKYKYEDVPSDIYVVYNETYYQQGDPNKNICII